MSKKPEEKLFSGLKELLTPSITQNTSSFEDSWSLRWSNNLAMQMVYWMVGRYGVKRPKTPPTSSGLSGDMKVDTILGPVVEQAIVVPEKGGSVRWLDFDTKFCRYSEIFINDAAEICFDSKVRGKFFRASVRTSIKSGNIAFLSDISDSISYDKSGRLLTTGCDTFFSAVVGMAVALLFNEGSLSIADAKRYYDALMEKCTVEAKGGKLEGKSEICDVLEKYVGEATGNTPSLLSSSPS